MLGRLMFTLSSFPLNDKYELKRSYDLEQSLVEEEIK
jgi:hypothetical protein